MFNQFNLSASYVNLSQYSTIAAADAAAVAGGFGLNIDKNYTLTSNTTLDAKAVTFSGGMISLGNFDLTFSSTAGTGAPIATPTVAPMTQIFSYTGTGVVKGTILANNKCVEWWGAHSDGTNAAATRKAFQYAGDYTIQAQPKGATIYCLGQNYTFDGTGVTFTSSAEMPFFVGSGITPDATNIVFEPSGDASAFTFIGGSAAPGGGGVDNIYIGCNSHGIGITANNAGFNKFRFGWAYTGKTPIILEDSASGFGEGNSITILGALAASSSAVVFTNSSGTGSFATTKIEPETNISLNPGDRSGVPIIDVGSGCFWYNGSCSGTFLNQDASNAYLFKKTGSTPPCYVSGNVKFEASDTYPIGFNDPSGGIIYFAGTVTIQGTNLTDFSNVIFPRIMSYGAGGVINTRGVSVYQQSIAQAGNTTFNFGGGGVGQDFKTFYLTVSNADNSYEWKGEVHVSIDTTGTAQIVAPASIHDSHSYGDPVFSISGGALLMTNASWPSDTFTAGYSVVAP